MYLNFGELHLGVEYGPKQYQDEFIDSVTQKDFSTELISMFSRLCPNQGELFKDLALVFPGPEYVFASDSQVKVKIVPIGSDQLIKESLVNYSEESRSFPQQVDQLSSLGRQAYEHFVQLSGEGKPLPQAKLDELVKKLRGAEKAKVLRYFNEVNKVFLLSDLRDEAHVEEVLKLKSDVVVVIGNFHASPIKDRILSRCETKKTRVLLQWSRSALGIKSYE